ncbi:MAG: hypothetical protein H6636_13795 [Anaerolineales bacterium]|nr:hypothetical protein [Anaerolineales bacterium]
MRSETVITSTGKHWLDEGGVLHAIYFPAPEHTLADARASSVALMQVAQGKRRPVLVDIREVKSVALEARKYYASEENTQIVSALVLLIESPISRMIGNFFMKLSNLPFPVSLFTDEEEALAWLRAFLKDEVEA